MIKSINLIFNNSVNDRSDPWWRAPFLMFVFGFVAISYLTWAAFQGVNYQFEPYVSPVYATPYVPDWWKLSPAFLLLWIPAGFRLTCYYGRKAYYRSAFLDPAGCSIEEPYRKKYRGEKKFPFVLQNLHRYFLYLALVLLILHWYELLKSIFYEGQIYIGVGTLILFVDTMALTMYVFGCHSLRHLVGGKKRCLSASSVCGCQEKVFKGVSWLNQFHNRWFWISLYSIMVADLYVRLLAMGVIGTDWHLSW